MSLTALPPVRRRVPLRRMRPAEGQEQILRFFGGATVLPLGSGTQSLAAALAAARARRSDVSHPEVILPAYGCPDLVSACVQVSVRPKLVDTAAGKWGYDIDRLRSALSADTVAIVAVNLLGVGDDAEVLAPVARAANAALIQDSAQHLPRSWGKWVGDAVVLSFGRGKPLNLLQGGALVVPHGSGLDSTPYLPEFERLRGQRHRLLSSRMAATMFNIVTSPPVFWWMSRVPGMGLGETRYKPPAGIFRLPEAFAGLMGPALEEYARTPSYDATPWQEAVTSWRSHGIAPLLAASGVQPSSEPLRLALLAPNRALRDRIANAWIGRGLGASILYGVPLNEVADVPRTVALQGKFPNAKDIADRLLTLPTHRELTPHIVAQTCDILGGLVGRT